MAEAKVEAKQAGEGKKAEQVKMELQPGHTDPNTGETAPAPEAQKKAWDEEQKELEKTNKERDKYVKEHSIPTQQEKAASFPAAGIPAKKASG